MKGLYFNCLARDHKVAVCRSPTKCWSCRCSGHISTRCLSRKDIKPGTSTKLLYSKSDHHARSTHKLADNKQPDAASPELLLGVAAPPRAQLLEPAEDPMRLEAELACRQQKAIHGKLEQCRPMEQIEVKQTEMKLIEAPERDYDQATHEPLKDSQTPLLLRSEVEKLIGHQLIKALSDFKHKTVAPLSSSTLHASPEKEKVVVGTKGKQRCSRKLKNKIRSQKPGIKVVRDILTKKWIFIKADKHSGDLTLKPFTASNFEIIKKLSEMALFMKAIRKLAEATEKDKKKGSNDKHKTMKC